jgi:hypothetical protein
MKKRKTEVFMLVTDSMHVLASIQRITLPCDWFIKGTSTNGFYVTQHSLEEKKNYRIRIKCKLMLFK